MDTCGVCGGQGRGCRLFEGIFMEPILPKGHQQVTTIPKGSMSLNISELRFSSNFLGSTLTIHRNTIISFLLSIITVIIYFMRINSEKSWPMENIRLDSFFYFSLILSSYLLKSFYLT